MTINTNDLLNSILDSLSRIDHAKLEALPDINLYMDQVITFMEKNCILQNGMRKIQF